jgi:hypothetical protein
LILRCIFCDDDQVFGSGTNEHGEHTVKCHACKATYSMSLDADDAELTGHPLELANNGEPNDLDFLSLLC